MNILSYVPKLTFSSDPFCTDAVKVLILVVVGEVVVIGGDGGDDATDSGDGRHQAVCHDVRGGKNT